MIKQGHIFWLDLSPPKGSEPGYRRPVVVLQSDKFNDSAIRTTVVCAITTNLSRADAPGNVLLEGREGGLKKPSVVNISQIFTVNKIDLTNYIGKLSATRMSEIVAGVKLLINP